MLPKVTRRTRPVQYLLEASGFPGREVFCPMSELLPGSVGWRVLGISVLLRRTQAKWVWATFQTVTPS